MSNRTRRLTATAATAALAALALGFTTPLASTPSPSSAPSGVSAYAPKLVTVDTPTAADKTRLVETGLDLTEHAGHDYVEVVLHSAADEALLASQGFTFDVRIEDLLARELERIQLDDLFAAENPVTALPSERNSYRVLSDFGTEIDALVAKYPATAKRISIGKSLEGRDLTGIEIGRNVNAPEDGRPVFLMFGAHHAREWPSAELPMEFAYDLLKNDGTDPRITGLVDRARVIIVPVSNPDGYDASRTSGSLVDLRSADRGGTVSILATPGNAYKRKNCRYVAGQAQPAGTCVLAPSNGGLGIGVDLNRNYGALWGGPGASPDSASATYRGPAPFSEPETQAIRNLISTRQVTTLITNHTFSNLILRPVGVNPATTGPDGYPIGLSPDEEGPKGMKALGASMAAANGYTNQFGWQLYDTTGTTEDYSYNATGGYGFTFEIGKHEFHPPFAEVIDEYLGAGAHAGLGNREAYLRAFENVIDTATHSVIAGKAPAGATLTVVREGTFPLWDGSKVADTVKTSMVVGPTGTFEWHVNPSTRPFVQSRTAQILSAPLTDVSRTGDLAPNQSTTIPLQLTEAADVIAARISTTRPVDGVVVNYRQFEIELRDPTGLLVAEGKGFGPTNVLSWKGLNGAGVPAGNYTLKLSNTAGSVNYTLKAGSYRIAGDKTPRLYENWTVTCTVNGRLGGQAGVYVERGERADVGELCR